MQKYYDYIISDVVYLNKPCYVFTVKVKKIFLKKTVKKALIRKVLSYLIKIILMLFIESIDLHTKIGLLI